MPKNLSNAQVLEILASDKSVRALAKEHGVPRSAIHRIRTGERYRHVRRPLRGDVYLIGDALKRMQALPDGYCPTIVTSPTLSPPPTLAPTANGEYDGPSLPPDG